MRRHAIVPEVFTYSAAISVCGKRQRHQQALHLLRVIQRHAIAPDVATYRAASSVCRRASSTSRPYISYERCSALPSCRL